ncbi:MULTISPECIES: hypothetical protein [Alteromonadaceae]|uniref:hypothetical protein n=1 Tax=Alteromonadaceae TaxID=72275 RepID=UPI003107810D
MNCKLNLKTMQEIADDYLTEIQGGSDLQYANFEFRNVSGRELHPMDPAKKGKKLNPPSDIGNP